MSINTREIQARERIYELIKHYYAEFHKKDETFREGQRIPYASRVYDHEEIIGLVDSALEFWLTSGRFTERFERNLADYLGVKHCYLVNSGSSANLLAFMALTSPLLGDKAIKPGDEVITVAAGFPTTVSPIVQYGAIPVFADITIPQYNIDVSVLETAVSEKTKCVMLAHTLGNPFDLAAVKAFCARHNLWLIEDNCDALGSEYVIDGERKFTGTIGHIGTSSFYPPHHMTMGEGGAVYSNDPELSKIIRSMRDWGRDCVCAPGQDNLCKNRFNGQHGEMPCGYDHKYIYSHFGYNLKATDMQAAIGVVQLKKLSGFTEKRRENFNTLKELLESAKHKLILPEACPDSFPSWFGFMVTCKEGLNRRDIVPHLESKGIQTRMLFAGNLTRQPCFGSMRENIDYKIAGSLENTDIVMRDSFWVGVYPGLTGGALNYTTKTVLEAIG